jgi:hypothetical protein
MLVVFILYLLCYSKGFENTTIRLAEPDPSFANTLKIYGATATPLLTTDGGKTWTVAMINIGDGNFPKAA